MRIFNNAIRVTNAYADVLEIIVPKLHPLFHLPKKQTAETSAGKIVFLKPRDVGRTSLKNLPNVKSMKIFQDHDLDDSRQIGIPGHDTP